MNEHHQPFEEIRHYGTEGQEFWSARELAPLLDYRDWRNFQKVQGLNENLKMFISPAMPVTW